MTIYHFTRKQLEKLLTDAIELFIDQYDPRDEELSRIAPVDQILEGIDAEREIAANDPTERLRLQLPED